jgi:hypothetical protein
MIMSDQNQQTAVFVDAQTQKELNEPLKYNGSSQNKDFLEMLVKLINEGKIQIYKPDTLINHEVYDKLDQTAQGKADYEAVNMLMVIREIKGLYAAGYKETYQIDNLVERLRVSKERLEVQGGDLFII